jgi:hypothetical protein
MGDIVKLPGFVTLTSVRYQKEGVFLGENAAMQIFLPLQA